MQELAKRIVKSVDPEYRGKRIQLVIADEVTLYNLHWEGGSRNRYMAVRIDNMKKIEYNPLAPWLERNEGKKVKIPNGAAVVCHSTFQGSFAGYTVFVNPGVVKKIK